MILSPSDRSFTVAAEGRKPLSHVQAGQRQKGLMLSFPLCSAGLWFPVECLTADVPGYTVPCRAIPCPSVCYMGFGGDDGRRLV